MGLGNRLWANFRLEAVDRIVEHASQSLIDARLSDVKAEQEFRIAKEEEADWGHGNGNELGATRMQRSLLIEWLQVGGITRDDRKAMELQKKTLTSTIKVYEKEKKDLSERRKTKSKRVTATKRTVLRVEQKKGRRKPVNITIEERYLTPRGVIRDVSHGGDMAGNSLHRLLCNAGVTFADIKGYLMEEADLRRKTEAEKRTIVKLCDNTMLAMQLLEAFLAIMRKKEEEITNLQSDYDLAESYMMKFFEVWRKLDMGITPKGHGLEHALYQFRLYKGMGDLSEAFMEREDQVGVKNMRRSNNIMDKTLRYMLHAQWEQVRCLPEVIRIKTEVKKSTKRNLSKPRKSEETKRRKRESRAFVRVAALAAPVSPTKVKTQRERMVQGPRIE